MSHVSSAASLPDLLQPLFWDVDFNRLSWQEDRDLITGRVLSAGTWDAVRWLRCRLGAHALGRWIVDRHGRGLSPQQLRFWQLILDLPAGQVDGWLRDRQADPWDRRQAS